MKKLKLFRGITLKESDTGKIIKNIQNKGSHVRDSAQWEGFVWKDLRNDLSLLMNKKGLADEMAMSPRIATPVNKAAE